MFVGKLFDVYQDYRPGFAVAGGMIAISGIMLFVIPCIQRRERNRRLKQNQKLTVESLLPNSDQKKKKILTNNNVNEDY